MARPQSDRANKGGHDDFYLRNVSDKRKKKAYAEATEGEKQPQASPQTERSLPPGQPPGAQRTQADGERLERARTERVRPSVG